MKVPGKELEYAKMKDLKSINYMRQEIKYKNLLMPFWKFYREKSIEVIKNGGWHFNSLLSPEEISHKLKNFCTLRVFWRKNILQ